MKYVCLIISLLTIHSLFSQSKPNGLYVDKKNNGAIFVINDTISINYFDSTRYYKGVFSMKNKEIVLYENMLICNNADVVTEECDKDYIEFSLYEKYRNYAMGASSTDDSIYCRKLDSFRIWYNDSLYFSSKNDTVLRIHRSSIVNNEPITFFIESEVNDFFYTEQCIDVVFGTRYVIIPKSMYLKPILKGSRHKNKSKEKYIYKKRKDEIIIKFDNNHKITLKKSKQQLLCQNTPNPTTATPTASTTR